MSLSEGQRLPLHCPLATTGLQLGFLSCPARVTDPGPQLSLPGWVTPGPHGSNDLLMTVSPLLPALPLLGNCLLF